MTAPSLSATIVTYRPHRALLARALASLGAAVVRAREAGALGSMTLDIVDNGPEEERGALREVLETAYDDGASIHSVRKARDWATP